MHLVSKIALRGGKFVGGNYFTKPHVGLLSKFMFYQPTQNFSVTRNPELLKCNLKIPLTQCRYMGSEFKIRHEENRFVIETKDGVAQLKYSIHNGVMDILHTGVPRQFRGHGVGRLLAKAALDYGVQSGHIIKISCNFVKSYVENYGPQYVKYIQH